VLTEGGHRMLANWLAASGHPVERARVNELERATKALQKAAVA
jgi:para-aminobenzoate synthetase component 2